jgi:hypothetical protein
MIAYTMYYHLVVKRLIISNNEHLRSENLIGGLLPVNAREW